VSDSYGAVLLPVEAPASPSHALSDTSIDTLLRWAKNIIEAKCGTAWAYVAPGEPIVRRVVSHRPERADFGADSGLPALFCYSDEGAPKRFADALFGRERNIVLLLVLPPCTQFDLARRSGVLSGLTAALHGALEGEPEWRDPAWVDYDDTDVAAPRWGSNILDRCGFDQMRMTVARQAEIPIDLQHGRAEYQAAYFEFAVVEYFRPGTPTSIGSSIGLTTNQNGNTSPAFVQTDVVSND
jgi:hypothetical protein